MGQGGSEDNMYAFYQKRNNLYPVADTAVDAAIEHAKQTFPQESCGVVIGGAYHPLANEHERPRDDFLINPNDHLRLVRRHGPLQAVIHSHPKGQPGPSHSDMFYQQNANVPFGIVVLPEGVVRDVVFFGDSVPIAPEIGRPFIHGVYDCYSLGRDHLRSKYGILLPSFPRQLNWWLGDGPETDMLEDNFQKAGFVTIDFNDMRPGDALMCRLTTAQKVNHCGVYVGDGLVLHHMFGSPGRPRLSVQEPVYNWRRFATHALRHKSFLQEPAK
jgi:proteasome lid subunit RPN8/RPN11